MSHGEKLNPRTLDLNTLLSDATVGLTDTALLEVMQRGSGLIQRTLSLKLSHECRGSGYS